MVRLTSQPHHTTHHPSHTQMVKRWQLPSIKSGNEKEKRGFQELTNVATNHRRAPMTAPEPSVWIYTVDLGFKSSYRRQHCRGPSLLRFTEESVCVWETVHVCKYISICQSICVLRRKPAGIHMSSSSSSSWEDPACWAELAEAAANCACWAACCICNHSCCANSACCCRAWKTAQLIRTDTESSYKAGDKPESHSEKFHLSVSWIMQALPGSLPWQIIPAVDVEVLPRGCQGSLVGSWPFSA